MACGCGCCGDGFVFGHLMYMLEKIAAFCAMSAIISCIIVTVIISIGIGVGIGYNYCFVDMKTSKLTALENFQNSDNPPKLPNRLNAFPFSGESALEKEVTTQNTNTFILNTTPLRMPQPTFPNAPNIRIFDDSPIEIVQEYTVINAPDGVESDTNSAIIPDGYESTPKELIRDKHKFVDGSETTNVPPNIPSAGYVETSDIPVDSNSDTQSNAGKTESALVKPNTADDSKYISDTSKIPGASDSFLFTKNILTDSKTNSSLGESGSIDNYSNNADDDILGGQESLNNQASNQNLLTRGQLIPNIPQSPNFPGSFRRIPIHYRPTAFVQRTVGRKNHQKFDVGPATNWRRKEFEEIREGIKENAKKFDKSFGTYRRVNKAEKTKFRQTEKADNNRRRIPVQRKKHNKVTTTTTYMPTIVIPLKKYANMSPLISKILAQNKNVTLQFITL